MRQAPASFLVATDFLDIEHEAVRAFTAAAIGDASTDRDKAKRLFAAVRDEVWYNPYTVSDDPAHYRASFVLEAGRAYCVPKAVLLTAVCRAAGIPARLGFADVRNHLQTESLRALMGGTDLFVYHGYSNLYIDGRWLKATPAFNTELCARFGVPPVEFDGEHDALLHAFTADGTQHMEYVRERGVFDDLPLIAILTELRNTYGLLMGASAHAIADAFTDTPTSQTQPDGISRRSDSPLEAR
ncbi:transglutaminase family protein (plasmid) [Rhodococcus sp. ZPP]|uniref:transglutaminase-like domain-containing protein n=1 Tax=unclassified Rhodococcus (in: high G+C Gram-positive bacteria) TaxID=192944 RepID=UPI00131FF6BC|nr:MULTISPECIES: transglutaminase family protein [unclassified Rhodococcus (in: high G+C Gram-positive bacteria)]QHE74093.1 Transglutaminase-like domain [Rhodococcus sp. WAY2]QTJ71045.1 transglutaminase family protein [Rhodococcus sp. ZPP]